MLVTCNGITDTDTDCGTVVCLSQGTRSIADAAESYSNSVRDAKTSKLRSDAESEKEILSGAQEAHGGRETAKGRGAQRASKKKGKAAKKKGKGGKKEKEKEAAPPEERVDEV
jgi:hypothetical protein